MNKFLKYYSAIIVSFGVLTNFIIWVNSGFEDPARFWAVVLFVPVAWLLWELVGHEVEN